MRIREARASSSSGSGRLSIVSAERQGHNRILVKTECTVDIEGEAKPALVAELLCLMMG